jgi:TetR/AcrR family tetracycline transcriptional repressor
VTRQAGQREGGLVSLADQTPSGSKGRKRGGPLRIRRAQIIEAAKTLDPQTMTMQAVADVLGVDRKALNYHVTDRDSLVRLVAEDAFQSHFDTAFTAALQRADQATGGDWRAGARAWAEAVRDSTVATNVAINHYRVDGDNPAVFATVELVLQRMLAAGFDHVTASRAVIQLTRLAQGVGHDIVVERQNGEHPQGLEVRRVLTIESDPEKYEAFRWLIAAELNSLEDIDNQFDFEVDAVIVGLQHMLPKLSSVD